MTTTTTTIPKAPAGAHEQLLATITEKDFQASVLEYATWCGWAHFHAYDARRSAAGWPDGTFVRGDRLVFAEFKSMRGAPSKAQRRWMHLLSGVPGVEVYLWKPSDWNIIERVLR